MSGILFASFNDANFSAIERVAGPLKARGIVPMILPGVSPPSFQRLKGWKVFSWKESGPGNEKRGEEIFEAMKPDFRTALIKKFGREKVLEHLESWSRIGSFAERVIPRESPDLIVLAPGSVESFYIQEICQRRLVRYCFLMPVFYEFKTLEFFDVQPVPYLVAGEAGRQRLIRKGADPEKVFVTGSCVFEELFKFRREPVYESKGERKMILFAAQGGRTDEILYGLLTRYLLHRPGVGLTVRPHPAEDPAIWHRRARSSKALGISSPEKPLNRELLEADVLVTASSACALNAFFLGTPVVSFKGGFFPEETVFAREGDAICVKNYPEIQEGLDRILFDVNFRKAWIHDHRECHEKYLSGANENAAERIAEVLTRVASPSPVMA